MDTRNLGQSYITGGNKMVWNFGKQFDNFLKKKTKHITTMQTQQLHF
jgi:hypothetical protein